MILPLLAVAVAVQISTPIARAESVTDVQTPRGQTVRVLIEKPSGTPTGSVVLLVGGHGRMDIGKDGTIGWGAGNQLVRTRADYARAGFVAVVPDIAPDMKTVDGVKSGYRWSSEQASDIGAVIRYTRSLAGPVHLVATSRATLTAAKVGTSFGKARAERPDSIVITAGMTVAVDPKQPSAERNVPGLGQISQPILLLHHVKDGCAYTPASAPARFKGLLTGAKWVDVKMIDGGQAGSGDPCQAQSHHGFLGQDGEVVGLIAAWLKALPQ